MHTNPQATQLVPRSLLMRSQIQLRWIAEGVEYESDQRHAELIVKGMEMENAAPAPSPGVTYTKEEAKAYEDSALMSNPDT